jgi:DNA-binding NtrC family response regulator
MTRPSREAVPGNLKTVAAVFVSEADLEQVRQSLAGDGVEVVQAPGLEGALQTSAPVILYDAEGPEEWSRAVREIAEMRPTVRVVLVSRKADNRMWVEVLTQGAYDLLPKPFSASEVRCVVLGALQTRASSIATAA